MEGRLRSLRRRRVLWHLVAVEQRQLSDRTVNALPIVGDALEDWKNRLRYR